MNLTIACYTASAFEGAGYDAQVNHRECRLKGGVIYQRPDGFGIVEVKACECSCHVGQNRSWIPAAPDKYWWRNKASGPVRLAL